MAYVQTRLVSVGHLVSGTFTEMAKIKREVGVYLAVFFAFGLVADLVEPLRGVIGFLATICYFGGQFYLYREIMARNGCGYGPATKAFSLFFMAVLIGMALMFAVNFFIIPAILLIAKWIMSPAYLVGEGNSIFGALGASWRASDYNLVSISGAFLVLSFIWVGLVSVVGAVSAVYITAMEGIGLTVSALETNAIGWIGFHLFPLLMMGLSVSAYMALNERENSLIEIFE